MNIISFPQKVLLLKVEATYSTDPVPAAGDAIFMLNGRISVQADKREREVDSSEFQSNPFVLTGKRVNIEAEVELVGGGTVDTPPACAPLLLAGGMSETVNATTDVTYAPISTGFSTFTAYFQIGRYFWKVVGGSADIKIQRDARDFPKIMFTFTGLFEKPVDQAPPVPDFTGWRDPLAIEADNWDVTLNGVTINVLKHELRFNNKVPYYEGSDGRRVQVIDRAPDGELTVFAPDIATIDLYDLADKHTVVALVDTLGVAVGDIVTINAPKVQLGFPEPVDVGDNAFGFRVPYTVREAGWSIVTQ